MIGPYTIEECDGESDCSPEEPGKLWLAINDGEGEEICVLVHRGDSIPKETWQNARKIIRALSRMETEE